MDLSFNTPPSQFLLKNAFHETLLLSLEELLLTKIENDARNS